MKVFRQILFTLFLVAIIIVPIAKWTLDNYDVFDGKFYLCVKTETKLYSKPSENYLVRGTITVDDIVEIYYNPAGYDKWVEIWSNNLKKSGYVTIKNLKPCEGRQ